MAWLACNPSSAIHRRSAGNAVPVRMTRCVDPRATAAIGSFCREQGIDVVHAHSPKDAWLCVPLHALGFPVVRSRQITNPVSSRWSRSIVYRAGCRHLIATAECIRLDLIRRNRVKPERISLVGEGVDLSRFHPDVDRETLRREFRIGSASPLFGVLAMIRPEKGHRTFIEAARMTLKSFPVARFAIIGEGTGSRETEQWLRKQLRSAFGSECGGPVFMTGFREDVEQVIAALDVVVVPSTAEAQSLVIPQAFASGRPVIASAVGGIPELVQHEETGLLTPAGNPAALADAMSRLIRDPDLRKRLGAAGLRYARSHLSFEDRMAETITVYRKAINRSSRRPRRAARARSRSSKRYTVTFRLRLCVTLLLVLLPLLKQDIPLEGWNATGPSRPYAFHFGFPNSWSAIQPSDPPPSEHSEIPPSQDDDDVLT